MVTDSHSVHAYDVERGMIMLQNRYPATDPDAPKATVNVEAVLADVNPDLLATGAWVNVVGYVSTTAPEGKRLSACVDVTATMIWSAGAIKMERYESAVRGYQKP